MACVQGAARTICLCVDDFGMYAGIDSAALHLAEMGRVHAISCLVGGESWAMSSPSLRGMDPLAIDVGLHLDLTETPLLGGSLQTLRELILGSYLGSLDRSVIRAEIRAQLDAFEQAMGRGPAFIDGHQHVHQLPGVRSDLLAELQVRDRGSMPWIRSARPPHGRSSSAAEWFKPRVIAWLGSGGLQSAASRLGYPQNRHLLGVYDFRGGRSRYRELLDRWFGSASDGDLLMCHPSRTSHQSDPLGHARHAEFEVLSGAEFDAALQRARLQLAAMSRILKRRHVG